MREKPSGCPERAEADCRDDGKPDAFDCESCPGKHGTQDLGYIASALLMMKRLSVCLGQFRSAIVVDDTAPAWRRLIDGMSGTPWHKLDPIGDTTREFAP